MENWCDRNRKENNIGTDAIYVCVCVLKYAAWKSGRKTFLSRDVNVNEPRNKRIRMSFVHEDERMTRKS